MDTQGLVIQAKVHPADLHDREGAKLLLTPLAGQLPKMAKVWADSAYQGLKKWLKETLGWDLKVVKHWWPGLGMGARGSGTSSSGHSCRISGFAPALGSGADLWVVRTKPAALQRL